MATQIGIVLGSYSDVKLMKNGMDRLLALGVDYEVCIASAHRTPGRLADWLASAEERGVKVIIAGAGAAAHLPGVVASKTLLPVIGVPFDATPLGGTDALYSIVQMPPGIPVATVGINSSENAVILALHILATSDPAIRRLLNEYRSAWHKKINEQNDKLYQEYPHARPQEAAIHSAPTSVGRHQEEDEDELDSDYDTIVPLGPAEEEAKSSQEKPEELPVNISKQKFAGCSTHRIDPENPDVSVIERAVDILLDGGVVALPTDTVYGLAVDATNAQAVQRLYMLKDRDPKKAIPVLIDTMKLFRSLVLGMSEGVERLVEQHWPGPLTLVARKKGAALQAVSLSETLGLRMPNNIVALGLISMLARPLATTSANISGQPPATTAQEVAATFGKEIDLILDAGQTAGPEVSTVLSVVETPYRILRHGALSEEALREILGELLA